MIGDIILGLIKFIKQQTCLHKYKVVYRKDNGSNFLLCEKCKRIN